MVIPEWTQFWLQVSASSGVIALVLLDLIIRFAPDEWDAHIEALKPYLAVLFTLVIPQIVTAMLNKYPTVDPLAWALIYLMGSYAWHEFLFRFVQKRAVPAVAKLVKPIVATLF